MRVRVVLIASLIIITMIWSRLITRHVGEREGADMWIVTLARSGQIFPSREAGLARGQNAACRRRAR